MLNNAIDKKYVSEKGVETGEIQKKTYPFRQYALDSIVISCLVRSDFCTVGECVCVCVYVGECVCVLMCEWMIDCAIDIFNVTRRRRRRKRTWGPYSFSNFIKDSFCDSESCFT